MASLNKGLTLVEVMIAAAIILAAVVALLSTYSLYLRVALANASSVKAAFLAEEGLEAMRYLRDASWSANIVPLSLGSSYQVSLSGSAWQISPGSSWAGTIERSIVLSAVYRDASGDIVSSGGILDPDTKLVTSSVSWQNAGATKTKSVSTYLTDLYEN